MKADGWTLGQLSHRRRRACRVRSRARARRRHIRRWKYDSREGWQSNWAGKSAACAPAGAASTRRPCRLQDLPQRRAERSCPTPCSPQREPSNVRVPVRLCHRRINPLSAEQSRPRESSLVLARGLYVITVPLQEQCPPIFPLSLGSRAELSQTLRGGQGDGSSHLQPLPRQGPDYWPAVRESKSAPSSGLILYTGSLGN